ncbi:hypothetical protein JAAARDRAFT_141625, partial [Jaapia argillacea MUCL 33604]
EATIGKALWHQVTTVVILRKNMRQRSQSANDQAFRTALENMRYKSKFQNPNMGNRDFRHVSIITARNIQRDRINEMGYKQYSIDTTKETREFFLYDTWAPPSDPANGRI